MRKHAGGVIARTPSESPESGISKSGLMLNMDGNSARRYSLGDTQIAPDTDSELVVSGQSRRTASKSTLKWHTVKYYDK